MFQLLRNLKRGTRLLLLWQVSDALTRGVARNLLRGGAKEGVWGTEVPGVPSPAGSRGRAPVGVWGKPPEAGDKC